MGPLRMCLRFLYIFFQLGIFVVRNTFLLSSILGDDVRQFNSKVLFFNLREKHMRKIFTILRKRAQFIIKYNKLSHTNPTELDTLYCIQHSVYLHTSVFVVKQLYCLSVCFLTPAYIYIKNIKKWREFGSVKIINFYLHTRKRYPVPSVIRFAKIW